MAQVIVRDMDDTDEYFVGTCSHVDESREIDVCAQRRIPWLRRMRDQGLRVKVALVEGKRAGFVYVMPTEACPWGVLGRELMVIPCLWVPPESQKLGVGRALIAAAEREARDQRKKGIVALTYSSDFWFMPASFFEKMGYSAARRRGSEAIMWKVFDPSAEVPDFLVRSFYFDPVPGKVVVDLFWNSLCETSMMEAERVREVAAEFGDSVILREYCADDRDTLCRYQMPRAILVNGHEIGWGYEAPREGIRQAISEALVNRS